LARQGAGRPRAIGGWRGSSGALARSARAHEWRTM